ncbi:hypothetical protein LMZ02_03620 [Paenibacillus macerans]|uniref:hypothetical protein n=1 Tax=Paenibacillus macerans TaxID=44252 RepID=UPI001F10B9DA|nr:hypothetical protein [Paenibacillus macerans]UMV48496.1 hypothetical protein LMZ02_03620 [Paenibacillus macerans]
MARNIGRSTSTVQTLCTIIPFDPEAERKINSGEENRFGRSSMFEIARQVCKKEIYGEVKQT